MRVLRRLLAAMGVFVIVQLAAFFLLYGPVGREIRETQAAIASLERDYFWKRQIAANLDGYRAQLATVDAELVAFRANELPDATDPAFNALKAAAQARGLRIELLEPDGAEELRDFYAMRSARFGVSGPFHSIGEFLADLGRAPGSLMVDRFSVERSAAAGEVALQGTARVFRLMSDEETRRAHKPRGRP